MRRETVLPRASSGQAQSRGQGENLLGGSDDDAPPAGQAAAAAAGAEGSVLGEPRASSPGEMGAATIDKMQRDQMMDMFAGLDRLDSTLGGGATGARTGSTSAGDVDDLI